MLALAHVIVALLALTNATNWTQAREDAREMFTFACLDEIASFFVKEDLKAQKVPVFYLHVSASIR